MAGLALRLPLVVRLWRRQSLRSSSWPRLLFHPAAPGSAAWTAERCGVAALAPGTLRRVPLLSRAASSWAAAAAESSGKKPGDPQETEQLPAAGPDQRAVSDAKKLLALAYPERWKLSGNLLSGRVSPPPRLQLPGCKARCPLARAGGGCD